MAYRVLSEFIEDGHLYQVGGSYPVEGTEVQEERVAYLEDASKNGAIAFIEKETTKDDRYDKYNVEALKKLLSDAGIDLTGVTKKPDLFKLADEKGLI